MKILKVVTRCFCIAHCCKLTHVYRQFLVNFLHERVLRTLQLVLVSQCIEPATIACNMQHTHILHIVVRAAVIKHYQLPLIDRANFCTPRLSDHFIALQSRKLQGIHTHMHMCHIHCYCCKTPAHSFSSINCTANYLWPLLGRPTGLVCAPPTNCVYNLPASYLLATPLLVIAASGY